jgi:hypothetical protein
MSVLPHAKPGYEVVFSVYEYHDGPRGGVANFHDSPHYYDCVFDEKSDEYSDLYSLTPLSPAIFNAAMENWVIFVRWRMEFDSGKVNLETHPALPEDKNRYDETKRILNQALESGREKAIRAKGEFENLVESNPTRDVLMPWQVKWSEL